jgi:glutamyl/glutaminyl-tRNA synthetase
MSGRAVLRFAPSPNGELHLGHALSALIGFEEARACGGRFLLRIEDIDTARTRSSAASSPTCPGSASCGRSRSYSSHGARMPIA